MNLPIRALYEIKAFSQPMTRGDWRTCKQAEAAIIKNVEAKYKRMHAKQNKVMFSRNATHERGVNAEMNQWTLYGRWVIFEKPKGWTRTVVTPLAPPTMEKPEFYLYRFKFMACGRCGWQLNGPEPILAPWPF
jgi:hypothetical protein